MAVVMALAGDAAADGLGFDQVGARSVGRAGAVMVSGDGAEALLINPAGLARRAEWRMQLGVSLHDSDSSFLGTRSASRQENRADDRAAPMTAPHFAVIGSIGPLVVGAAYLRVGGLATRLERPPRRLPADPAQQMSLEDQFVHRYGGLELRYQQHGALVGAAMRVLPWLGVGVSVAAYQARHDESRHVWGGIEELGDRVEDLGLDFNLVLDGRDDFVPGASLGVLIAPLELPLEVAVSASMTTNARLSGSAQLDRWCDEQNAPCPPNFPRAELDQPGSELEIARPLIVRAGVRYLGERLTVEAGGELFLYLDEGRDWQLRGVNTRHRTQITGSLERLPALIEPRDHGALRIATDIDIASGFLWVSAGYAYRTAGSSRSRHAPGHADLAGHTVALGVESQWNGMTLNAGYSRTIHPEVTTVTSDLAVVSTFDGKSTAGMIGEGSYSAARDVFGLSFEVAWE